VMTPFESAVKGSLEGSRGGRTYVHNTDDLGDRATPLSGTQLADTMNCLIFLHGGNPHRARGLPLPLRRVGGDRGQFLVPYRPSRVRDPTTHRVTYAARFLQFLHGPTCAPARQFREFRECPTWGPPRLCAEFLESSTCAPARLCRDFADRSTRATWHFRQSPYTRAPRDAGVRIRTQ
jgi:hypothetical protein